MIISLISVLGQIAPKLVLVVIIEIPGTAELDWRGKPVSGGEWNTLPRDHGDHHHQHPPPPNEWSRQSAPLSSKSKINLTPKVIVLHREYTQGGSIGVTLAGGADYESKEITVIHHLSVQGHLKQFLWLYTWGCILNILFQVHKVIAGSLADRDGRIQKGDRVLSINGRSTKGVSHREALSILKVMECGGQIVVIFTIVIHRQGSAISINPGPHPSIEFHLWFLHIIIAPPVVFYSTVYNEGHS